MTKPLTLILVLALLGGCAGMKSDYDPYVAAVEGQLETRSYQTREIADTGRQELVTAIISTLQDYHFRIVDIDPDLGTITAYQNTSWRHDLRLGGKTALTVMVRPKGERNWTVRMNMSTGLKVDGKAELYQQFFSALQHKLHYRTTV